MTADGGLPSVSDLFLDFLRLGATAFGGPAMVVYIEDLAVTRRRWLSEAAFRDGVALCQAIPGATAMQTAAYVGLRARGFEGAAAAYVGFGLPAFCLMLALSAAYLRAESLPITLGLFRTLRAVVVAIVANAAWMFARSGIRGRRTAALAAAAAAALVATMSPAIVIGGCALLGAFAIREPSAGRAGSPAPAVFPDASGAALALLAVAAGAILLLFRFDRPLFDVAVTMLRVDLLAFGGGFASVPLMQHEVTDVRGWMSVPTFMDGIALGQVTPGPIVITATFVGYIVSRLRGGFVATAAVFLPSFALVVLVGPRFERLQRLSWFRGATAGARVSFVGLLAAVAVRFALTASWTTGSALVAVAALAALRAGIALWWVVGGAVLTAVVWEAIV